MMNQWYGMSGAGWLTMTLVVLALAGLVAAVAVALVRGPTTDRRPRETGGDAERILADRFARGEIDAEEYESRLGTLRGERRR
jgi:putative membrane protein